MISARLKDQGVASRRCASALTFERRGIIDCHFRAVTLEPDRFQRLTPKKTNPTTGAPRFVVLGRR